MNSNYSHPDREECLEYLNEYGTPAHVIAHCKSVAAVSFMLGKALNEAGGTKAANIEEIEITTMPGDGGRTFFVQDNRQTANDKTAKKHKSNWRELDLSLLISCGLLHDMARVKDNHWDVCADWCRDKGFYSEEKIIRAHMMYYITNDAEHLTEMDLVSLGDRLSLEDHYAGLDERMEYIIKKAEKNGHPEARYHILKRKQETRKLLSSIESRLGISIDELMTHIDYDNVERMNG